MAAIDRDLIATALRLAEAAAPVAKKYFRKPIPIDDKADDSPVTVADREIEQTIRRILAAERPNDGIIGEEYGAERPDAAHVWVIDPIDGTRSFITGKPCFGTLIALLIDGVPELGVIAQPITGETWVGATGHASTMNGAEIRVRGDRNLSNAYLYATGPELFAPGAETEAFGRLAKQVKNVRYSADCYAYGLLALGCIDLVCESGLKIYDYAAVVPVITGAGGVIAAWNGDPLTRDNAGPGRVLAAGSPLLHAAARGILAGTACA